MLVGGGLLSTKMDKLEVRNLEVRQSTSMSTGEHAAKLGNYGEVAKKDRFYSSGARKPSWWLW